MKTSFQIEIDIVSLPTFFPRFRIKTKLQLLEILLESARYVLHSDRSDIVRSANKIIFCRDKMNRIFFVNEKKMYSITFPFDIDFKNNQIVLNYKNLIVIDSLSISNLLILLKSPLLKSNNCLDFVEPILDLGDSEAIKYWPVFKDLLMLEEGYLRYDIDEPSYTEAKSKGQEHRHPMHHIDIFYTNGATFKLGLKSMILDKEFVDTLNTDTNCKYVVKAK
jgi:hypothetical protein